MLRRSTEYLETNGSPTPRLDAELLLAHGLGLTRIDLYTQFERPLSEDELSACRELIRRRGRREPVAYVIGRWGFRRLELDVDARVLVPRPETELLVERCLALLDGRRAAGRARRRHRLGRDRAGAQGRDGPTRASRPATSRPMRSAVARANADRLGLEIDLAESDLLDAVPGGPFELIVSNPPYISEPEVATLEPEVTEYEPRLATVAGAEGSRCTPAAASGVRPARPGRVHRRWSAAPVRRPRW